MFKRSMSVSPYSIAQFLNFVLKNKKQKVFPIGIYDEGDGLVAVVKLIVIANCRKFY